VFKRIVRQLLQGKALSTEDMADVLTLKDNSGSVENYAIALHLLARVKVISNSKSSLTYLITLQDLPEARRISACQACWRRVYLHDECEPLVHRNPAFC
jgi:nuclear pore complex protein Nup133